MKWSGMVGIVRDTVFVIECKTVSDCRVIPDNKVTSSDKYNKLR